MFFFIIGFGRTTVDYLGSAGTQVCPNCGNTREWSVIRVKRWVTLFFIPIYPYKSYDAAICPVCRYEAETN